MSWYYDDGGEQRGPVSEDSVQDLIRKGTITSKTLVWRAAMGEWREAGTVPGLLMPPPLPASNGASIKSASHRSEGAPVTERQGTDDPESASTTPSSVQKAISVSAAISTFFLAVSMLFSVLGLYLFFKQDGPSPGTGIFASIGFPELISFFILIVIPLAGISFIIWFTLKHKTTASLAGGGLRFSNIWAVVGWFIPLAHLFIPYQVASEVWIKSDEACVKLGWPPRKKPEDSELAGFWFGFVIMNCLPVIGLLFFRGSESGTGAVTVLWLLSILVGAFAGINFILKLEQMQSIALAGERNPPPAELTAS